MYHKRRFLSILLIVLVSISIFFVACDNKRNSLVVNEGEFSVHFLDVGQGDAILINFPDGKNMLIDTGNTSDAVANYVIDCVKKSDKTEIDYLVLTHTDSDHIGNAIKIIDTFKVKNAFVPKVDNMQIFPMFSAVVDMLNAENAEIITSSYMVSISGEGWFIGFLSPAPPNVFGSSYDDLNTSEVPSADAINNLSPIIYLKCQNKRFLFTGDAGVNQESLVVNNYKSGAYDDLFGINKIKLENIDVLKVSHHGANDSSSEKFLQLLTPKNVIISVGENNYGHPATAILTRIQNLSPDVNFYRTDINGTISARFDKENALKFDCINAPKKI